MRIRFIDIYNYNYKFRTGIRFIDTTNTTSTDHLVQRPAPQRHRHHQSLWRFPLVRQRQIKDSSRPSTSIAATTTLPLPWLQLITMLPFQQRSYNLSDNHMIWYLILKILLNEHLINRPQRKVRWTCILHTRQKKNDIDRERSSSMDILKKLNRLGLSVGPSVHSFVCPYAWGRRHKKEYASLKFCKILPDIEAMIYFVQRNLKYSYSVRIYLENSLENSVRLWSVFPCTPAR